MSSSNVLLFLGKRGAQRNHHSMLAHLIARLRMRVDELNSCDPKNCIFQNLKLRTIDNTILRLLLAIINITINPSNGRARNSAKPKIRNICQYFGIFIFLFGGFIFGCRF